MKKYLNIFVIPAQAGIQLINNEVFAPVALGFKIVSFRHPIETLLKLYLHFGADSLYRNSIYLMLSTAIMAFFGFFFWIINARLYTPEQVGIATTLISAMALISSFSLLGLNIGLVRFLPKSVNRNDKINSSFIINIFASILMSVIFLLGIQFFTPNLIFLQQNLLYGISFTLFVIALSANSVIDSIFIAYRSTKYTLLKNTIFSVIKLILPVFLLVFSAYGILASVGIGYIVTFLVSIWLLIHNFKYQPKFKINLSAVHKIGMYSFGNYIVGFLGGIPALVLPIIISNNIGVAEAGYFYIAMMIANLIFIIPQSTTLSLFAEGTYNKASLKIKIKKTTKITFILLLFSLLIMFFLSNIILRFFGENYELKALTFLHIISFSALFIAIDLIGTTILRIKHKISLLIKINIVGVITIIGACYILLPFGLIGIGWGWLIGNILLALMYLFLLRKSIAIKK